MRYEMIIMPATVNFPMIKIRHIQSGEIATAKQLIYRVAHQVFHDTRPLEEFGGILRGARTVT